MCKYCKDFNEEKQDIEVDGIKIRSAGYYNYSVPIIYCPACGKILNKYKNRTKEQIEMLIEYGV